jgi:predicted DNA-binding transcriptional regulator YafY
MSSMQRIYQIDQILGARHSVTRAELQERLGVSWATLKRDIAYMRDRLNAPDLIFDRHLGGYRFEKAEQRVGPQYELPGLWFTAEEIHALLTMQHLLSNLDTGGLLGPQIRPLLARLTGLLGSGRQPGRGNPAPHPHPDGRRAGFPSRPLPGGRLGPVAAKAPASSATMHAAPTQ